MRTIVQLTRPRISNHTNGGMPGIADAVVRVLLYQWPGS